jgi:hypothetical protein
MRRHGGRRGMGLLTVRSIDPTTGLAGKASCVALQDLLIDTGHQS